MTALLGSKTFACIHTYILQSVTHTRTLRKLAWSLCSLGRVTRNAPNLNTIANMRIWTTSAMANTKPKEMALLYGSLHNVTKNQQHEYLSIIATMYTLPD